MQQFQVSVYHYEVGASRARCFTTTLVSRRTRQQAVSVARDLCRDARASGCRSVHYEILPYSPLFGVHGDPLIRFRG